MSILVSFVATAVFAVTMVWLDVMPDRWLFPSCLVCFVVLAAVLHGAEGKAHA
jgi:hypothetical protein